MLNSESIVIIRIKGNIYYIAKYPGDDWLWVGECLLYSKFPTGEYLLYSEVSGGKVYYIANILRGNVYSKHSGERFTIRHRNTDYWAKSYFQINHSDVISY